MSWNPHMEVQYANNCYPYNSAGSFMEYFEGLTYEHVNFIFAGASHAQESLYPTVNSSFYKFGLSETVDAASFDLGHAYVINDHEPRIGEYRRHLENQATLAAEQTRAISNEWEESTNTTTHDHNPVECPRRHHNSHDYQAVWQDSIDPDSMSYEELLELGEAVGAQNRGLSAELISKLPVSKFKCGFFSRKKLRDERCVICQMEYKRGDRQITLPCKHAYHVDCGTKWLGINKACPICYVEVFADASKR